MKRLCVTLLAALALAGCGGQEPTPTPEAPATPALEARPAPTSAPAAGPPVRERETRTRAVRGQPPVPAGRAGETTIVEQRGADGQVQRIQVERLPNGEVRSTILD